MFTEFNRYATLIILSAILSLLLVGCGGGAGVETPEPTYSVTGKVVDVAGSGLSGVTVRISSSTASGTAEKTTTTDSSGSYTFIVPTGEYTVSSADNTYGFDTLNVTVPGATITVPERAAYPVFTVTGKIALANGTPISGATVKLYNTDYSIYTIDGFYTTRNANGVESVTIGSVVQTVSTNGQGVYSFSGVRSGKYSIVPTSSTHVFKWSQVPTRDNIGVLTITGSLMVYTYNPEGSGNKLSADGPIIYNTGDPFIITGNMLDGQNFEAAVPGSGGI